MTTCARLHLKSPEIPDHHPIVTTGPNEPPASLVDAQLCADNGVERMSKVAVYDPVLRTTGPQLEVQMSALEGSRDHPLNSHPAHDYLILLGDTIDCRGIKLKKPALVDASSNQTIIDDSGSVAVI
ncbi:hypothetical protein B0H13DRAFT_2383730 [Mycena leptocephala]|nr:hypothetical protein B0H13DRAFT_2383730 [Mycena leptocephala]